MTTPTNEQRLAIFSAYHRQSVVVDCNEEPVNIYSIDYMNAWIHIGYEYNSVHVSKISILLRSIEQMTDDELLKIAKIFNCNPCKSDLSEVVPHLKYVLNNQSQNQTGYKIWEVINYLISIGIAVPMQWLTVQDMIDSKIITIKE